MSNTNTIQVFDIVGGGLCVSSDDGQLVHDKIAELLREKRKVIISFENIDTLISAFLNAAIGQLYGEFSEDDLRASLSVEKMTPDDRELLRRVIENAKIYFENREKFDAAWKEEVSDEE
ncbi:MAG: STAS-like domain-containing protein [Methylococcales bacterium]|nr:STAS-like domain-containing protein [Methylococcales bacterium]